MDKGQCRQGGVGTFQEEVRRLVHMESDIQSISRYFFYATEARKSDQEYSLEDGAGAPESAPSSASSETEPEDVEEKPVEKSEEESPHETDPSLADWFKPDSKDAAKGKAKARDETETDSETEPESDNEDVRDDDEVLDDQKDIDDEWFNVPTSGTVGLTLSTYAVRLKLNAFLHRRRRRLRNHKRCLLAMRPRNPQA